MHEYPVTLEIVRIAEKTAREKGGLVKAIHLVVGEDSGFIGESIQMYFDVISEGTLCEGARLTIRDIKASGRMPTSDEVQQIREDIVQAVSGVDWNMGWKEFYRWQKCLRDNDPVGDGGLNYGNTE